MQWTFNAEDIEDDKVSFLLAHNVPWYNIDIFMN